MTWLQILAQAAIMATFLGVGVAIAAYITNRYIKEMKEGLGGNWKNDREFLKGDKGNSG